MKVNMRSRLKARAELDEYFRIQAAKHDIHVSENAVSIIASQGLHGILSSLGLLDIFIKRRVIIVDHDRITIFKASYFGMRLKNVVASSTLDAVANERTVLRYQHWVLDDETYVIQPRELDRVAERSGGVISIPSRLIE